MIFGGIILGIIVIAGIIIGITALTTDKMHCKSSLGSITIMYNDSGIKGSAVVNMSYDLEGQQAIANTIGVENYLDQFEAWFEENTGGTCERK